MRTINFLINTAIISLLSFMPGNSQSWNAFLEKHIDHIVNADTIPGLEHQYSEESILGKKSEMLSLIYNNEMGWYNNAIREQ
jgi:hypothetical protein